MATLVTREYNRKYTTADGKTRSYVQRIKYEKKKRQLTRDEIDRIRMLKEVGVPKNRICSQLGISYYTLVRTMG